MIVKSIIKRYLVFITGLYLLAMGIVLIVRSSLGTTPISSINYVLSLHSPLSLGTWTFIINLLLIAGQFFLVRKKKNRKDIVDILLQLPFSFVFSAFIDFNMTIMGNLHPSGYGMSVVLLLLGCIVQSIGVVFEIKPKVTMMSAEAFVKHASCHCNKDFGKFKVCFDITLVMFAVMISLVFTRRIEGVREGSLIAACTTGYIINFLNHRIMTRRMLYRLLPVLKKNR